MHNKKIIASIALIAGLSATSAMAQGGTPNRPENLTGTQRTSEIGLLLPAVQKVREAPRRPQKSRRGQHNQSQYRFLGKRTRSSARLGQDGNDLLIVNNGDGSDF